jgi:exopolyphosphatase/guanosine-5'-triphosphate,3'-diphosphate pyrophosphatase
MRCACIDIGSNTTRLLVADRDPANGTLREVTTERVFTAIGAAAGPDGALPAAKIAEVAGVAAAQAASARGRGAETIRVVATAAIRRAPNREALAAALARIDVALDLLSPGEEARLAFAGAIASLPAPPPLGPVAVVDVGGGSTELVAGRAGGEPAWWVSLAVGSSSLTGRCVRHDPPSPACLAALHDAARDAFAAVAPPPVELGLAVGGSATALLLVAGGGPHPGGAAALDRRLLTRALDDLVAGPAAATALRLGLEPERVRVMPAGITLLARASLAFATPLRIARGGLREGVVLELLGSS